jgi:hypothetical protein
MENHIVSSLQLYKKPDKDFLKDKECLICLETIDLEVAKIVKLPCGCSNSVYHIVCIAQLLSSGKNKNFCPHCKSNYELTLQQVVQHSNLIAVQPNTENERTRLLSYIILVHIFSNSIMNLINIGLSHDYSKNDANIISKILQISYFCKILVNVCIIINLKVNVEQINSHLSLSYIIQAVLFVLLICLLSMIEHDFNSIIMLLNNVFFVITDLGFRIRIECKGMNRVNVIEAV